jgi:hypothetical protein
MLKHAEKFVEQMPNDAKKYYARAYLKWTQLTEFKPLPNVSPFIAPHALELRQKIDGLLNRPKKGKK